MYPVFLIVRSNLKTKKAQSIIIAVIVLLASLLLTAAVAVLTNTGEYFRDIHRSVNGSHTVLQFENGLHDPEAVHDWWAAQDGVETSDLFRYVSLTQFVHDGQEISNLSLYMTNAGPHPLGSQVDRLIFAEREGWLPYPRKGTVWIPTSLALSKSISLGDTLAFKWGDDTRVYRVSGIVVDVPFSQPFTVTARIWMNGADYAGLTADGGVQEKALMGLRFRDLSEENAYWQRFAEHFGSPFLETIIDYGTLTSFYFLFGQMLGLLKMLMSIVMLAIALYTVSYTVSDAILSNYRTLGIYQSLGMSGSRIAWAYVLQYVLIALPAAAAGALAGWFGARSLLSMTLAYLRPEDGQIDIRFAPYAAGAVLFICGLTGLFAWLFASGARKLDPVQAIRYGTAGKRQLKAGSLGNAAVRLPVELIIAIRRMLGYKGAAVMAVLVSALTTAVLMTGILIYSSVKHLHPSKWGYDNADISVQVVNETIADADEIDRALRGHPSTEYVGRFGNVYGVPAEVPEDAGLSGLYITFTDGDLDRLGYETFQGRHPVTGAEIALGARAAELLGKRIGDEVELYIQGRKAGYTVTGIYQGIPNMSLTARMTADGIGRLALDHEPHAPLYFIVLRDGADPDAFIADLRSRFGDAIYAASQETLLKETFDQALKILIWPLAAMGLFILAIGCGIIYSVTRIQVKRDGRILGVYRALGMTAGRVRLALLSCTALLSAAGVLTGHILGFLFVPNLLDALLRNYGIVQFPAHRDAGLLAAAAAAGWAAILLGSWLASSFVKHHSLRSLVEEA